MIVKILMKRPGEGNVLITYTNLEIYIMLTFLMVEESQTEITVSGARLKVELGFVKPRSQNRPLLPRLNNTSICEAEEHCALKLD